MRRSSRDGSTPAVRLICPRCSGHVGEAVDDRLDDRVIAEDTGGERLDLACGGDRVSPAVGRGADCHSAFGYLVAEATPRRRRGVEREVNRSELTARDVPVRLLASQRQVDEVDEHALKLARDTAVLAAVWNLGLVCSRLCGHFSSLGGSARGSWRRGFHGPRWVGACIRAHERCTGGRSGWLEQRTGLARPCGSWRAWRRSGVASRLPLRASDTAQSGPVSCLARMRLCRVFPRATSATRCWPPEMVSEPHGRRKAGWTGSAHEASPVDAALRREV